LCRNSACPAVTFAVQPDGLTARYQRRSVPLARLLSQIGLELAGRAGARLASALGIGIHRSTLLRMVAALPEPPIKAAAGSGRRFIPTPGYPDRFGRASGTAASGRVPCPPGPPLG
jgi:hypothetical protein